jgi:rRNA-processing protein FCF1
MNMRKCVFSDLAEWQGSMTPDSTSTRKKLKIILDANALFVPFQFNIDIFEELKILLNRNFELVLLSPTLHEVQRIASQGSPSMRKKASYALNLAEKCKLLEVNSEAATPTDDLILQVAARCKYPVFTNDRQLRNRLRDINMPVIYVRQKSRLEIDGRL